MGLESAYTKFISGFLFPLHEGLKKHSTHRILKELENTQWLSREEIDELQLTRLKRFLTGIGGNVPYFSEVFKNRDFDASRLTSVSGIAGLPLMQKNDIRSNLGSLAASNPVGLSRFATGGSTGEPLIFYLGRERVSHDVAAKWRATRWWNVDVGVQEVVVWGSPIELGAQNKVRQIRDRLFRTTLLPAFDMSENRLDEFIDLIKKKRPRMLFGYPSAIARIAEHANKKGSSLEGIGIRVVFVTGETLYDHQRRQIENTFGCPVANGYGGRDSGFIAHECREGGMHITAEDIIVEIVDEDGTVLPIGQPGEIVVTHLATRDFPFVRYRTGDIAALSDDSCRCGRGLPLLTGLQGRTSDFVVAEDGTLMHGLALIYVLREVSGIDRFKIIQESIRDIRIQIIKQADFPDDAVEQIVRNVSARMGDGIRVNVEFCTDIPNERSGKYRYVVSRLTPQTYKDKETA